jgi:hypothetical protein
MTKNKSQNKSKKGSAQKESVQNVGNKTKNGELKQNLTKLVGLVICFIFIAFGAFMMPALSSKVDNNENLTDEIVKLKIFLSEKIAESNHCWEKIKDEFANCNAEKYRELINKYAENTAKDKKIENQIKKIEEYINFQKKIKLADIFFQHVLKLIFILSGIFGLLWISIWRYREEREGRKKGDEKERAEKVIEEIKRKLESE